MNDHRKKINESCTEELGPNNDKGIMRRLDSNNYQDVLWELITKVVQEKLYEELNRPEIKSSLKDMEDIDKLDDLAKKSIYMKFLNTLIGKFVFFEVYQSWLTAFSHYEARVGDEDLRVDELLKNINHENSKQKLDILMNDFIASYKNKFEKFVTDNFDDLTIKRKKTSSDTRLALKSVVSGAAIIGIAVYYPLIPPAALMIGSVLAASGPIGWAALAAGVCVFAIAAITYKVKRYHSNNRTFENATTPSNESETTPSNENATTPSNENATTPLNENETTPLNENETTPSNENETTPSNENETTPSKLTWEDDIWENRKAPGGLSTHTFRESIKKIRETFFDIDCERSQVASSSDEASSNNEIAIERFYNKLPDDQKNDVNSVVSADRLKDFYITIKQQAQKITPNEDFIHEHFLSIMKWDYLTKNLDSAICEDLKSAIYTDANNIINEYEYEYELKNVPLKERFKEQFSNLINSLSELTLSDEFYQALLNDEITDDRRSYFCSIVQEYVNDPESVANSGTMLCALYPDHLPLKAPRIVQESIELICGNRNLVNSPRPSF